MDDYWALNNGLLYPTTQHVKVIPNGECDLGEDEYWWTNAKVIYLHVGTSVKTSLNPDEDGTRDLGIDNELEQIYWGSGYLHRLKLRQELTLLEDYCTINGSLVPLTSGDFNIGKKTVENEVVTITRWQDAYLTTLDVAGDVAISGNGNALKLYYGEHFVGLKAPSSMIASSTYTLPAAMGDTGQVLSLSGTPTPGQLAWVNPATGNVIGPGSATSNAVARFNSTSGKIIKNSVVTITEEGDITGAHDIIASGNVEVAGDGKALKLYYGSYSVGLMAPYGLNANSGYTLPAAIGQIGQVLAIQAFRRSLLAGLRL